MLLWFPIFSPWKQTTTLNGTNECLPIVHGNTIEKWVGAKLSHASPTLLVVFLALSAVYSFHSIPSLSHHACRLPRCFGCIPLLFCPLPVPPCLSSSSLFRMSTPSIMSPACPTMLVVFLIVSAVYPFYPIAMADINTVVEILIRGWNIHNFRDKNKYGQQMYRELFVFRKPYLKQPSTVRTCRI